MANSSFSFSSLFSKNSKDIGYGGKSDTIREHVQRINSVYRAAHASHSPTNSTAFLAQTVDHCLDLLASLPQDETKLFRDVKQRCTECLDQIRQAKGPQASSQNPLSLKEKYQPESTSFAEIKNRKYGGEYFLAHSHSDHTYLSKAKDSLQSPNPQTELKKWGISDNMKTRVDNAHLDHDKKEGLPTDPTLMARAFDTQYVVYLRKEGRKRFQMRFDGESQLVKIPNLSNPQKDEKLDTAKKEYLYAIRRNKKTGMAEMCAMPANHDINQDLCLEDRQVEVQHSSFFGGKAIVCAGQLIAENGVLTDIDNRSGHYQPTWKDLQQCVKLIYDLQGQSISKDMTATVLCVGLDPKSKKNQDVVFRYPANEFREDGAKALPRCVSFDRGNTWIDVKSKQEYTKLREQFCLNQDLEATVPRQAFDGDDWSAFLAKAQSGGKASGNNSNNPNNNNNSNDNNNNNSKPPQKPWTVTKPQSSSYPSMPPANTSNSNNNSSNQGQPSGWRSATPSVLQQNANANNNSNSNPAPAPSDSNNNSAPANQQ